MHAGRKYTLKEITLWTRRETFLFLFFAAIPTALYALANCKWLALPWLPIAMVGTAVAFVTGFKNNASYARLWEARQIWGAIVNGSRAWAVFTINSIPDPATRQRLFLRHFAWLTALRYQLREKRSWENMNLNYNIEYKTQYDVAEWTEPLEPILANLLTQENLTQVFAKKNRAFHILDQQSRDLQSLLPAGNDLRQIEMQHLIAALIDAQGKCERIKNFPYPRQFATLNNLFTWLFAVLVPFGLLQEFHKMGEGLVWLTIPASTIVAWVFHTMDKIGEGTENPFEGGPNDVPITALSRTIEIDLREMLGEATLPPAIQPRNNILT